ncbi:MAG TPA: hypothetical protein VGG79_14390 [Roseiarcus sp.]|jgi:hypothetical protein
MKLSVAGSALFGALAFVGIAGAHAATITINLNDYDASAVNSTRA